MFALLAIAIFVGLAIAAYSAAKRATRRDLEAANNAGSAPVKSFALARTAYVLAPPLIDRLLEQALVRAGFEVTVSSNSGSAAAFLSSNAVQLLVVDDATADVDDLRALRELVPIAKLVVVTGNPMDAAHRELIARTGAVKVLLRPFTEETIGQAISEAEQSAQTPLPPATSTVPDWRAKEDPREAFELLAAATREKNERVHFMRLSEVEQDVLLVDLLMKMGSATLIEGELGDEGHRAMTALRRTGLTDAADALAAIYALLSAHGDVTEHAARAAGLRKLSGEERQQLVQFQDQVDGELRDEAKVEALRKVLERARAELGL